MRIMRVAAFLVLGLSLMLVASGQKPTAVSFSSWASHNRIGFSTLLQIKPVCAASAAQPTTCSECPEKCKSLSDGCKNGDQVSCYRAAACLCQCNLDAGGCGSSREALQKCIDENTKKAQDAEQLE
jgi:hypothetical protein